MAVCSVVSLNASRYSMIKYLWVLVSLTPVASISPFMAAMKIWCGGDYAGGLSLIISNLFLALPMPMGGNGALH